jgi:hypothetical protein
MTQNKKQANINIRLKDLFTKWLEITNSFHHLTKQETNVLGLLLYYHYKYRYDITNSKIIWKMVFDYDTKKLIKQELGIKDSVFQNILTKLRKSGIIKDNRIVSTYIPQLDLDSKGFMIIFNFNIIHE